MDDLDPTRFLTLMGNMRNGDLRPLAAAIWEGPVEPIVLYYLALMIDEGLVIAKGRVTVKRPRGRPQQREKSVRDRMIAQLYEKLAENIPSADALQKAADTFRTTEAAVRKAVTSWRSSKK
jgi:hypothetical protein